MKRLNLVIILVFLSVILASKVEVDNLFERTGVTYNGKIYSGYLSTGVPKKEHFYLFTESQTESKKLLIYIHGGPGCSSISNALAETGPVIAIKHTGTFILNEHSWNKELNVLYLESPAGVGFSKTNDPKTSYTDTETAKANYNSIVEFMELFKEYAFTEVYIAGASYGGVYIPYLIKEIYSHQDSKLDIKGILIGNGLTDKNTDVERSMVDFGYMNAIISPELKREFDIDCPHIEDDLYDSNDLWPREVTPKCNDVRRRIKKCFEGSDVYGIYHQCKTDEKTQLTEEEAFMTMLTKQKSQVQLTSEPEISIWPNMCKADPTIDTFMNSKAVKDKLQVNASLAWTQCNMDVMNNYKLSDSYDIYINDLFTKGLRVWFYSGDSDACITTLGSLRWINKTKWEKTKEYTQWKYLNQVAGFYQVYKNGFTFVTVKGAGHLSCMDKGPEMKKLLDSFIAGKFTN